MYALGKADWSRTIQNSICCAAVNTDTASAPLSTNPSRPKLGKPNHAYMYPPMVGAQVLMTELAAMLRPSAVPVAFWGTRLVMMLLASVLSSAPDITMGTKTMAK